MRLAPGRLRSAALGSLHVSIEPSAGVMVTIDQRVCNMVINLLSPPVDGDIIVPQRETSILGTTSWKVEDPDNIPVIEEHIEMIFKVAELTIPAVRQARIRGQWQLPGRFWLWRGRVDALLPEALPASNIPTKELPAFSLLWEVRLRRLV